MIVTAALCAWAVWQPERAARSTERATSLRLEGKKAAALREADRAREIDPYSADPLFVRAEVLDAMGHRTQAYRSLEQAVIEHPRDPETWLRLGRYELETLDLPDRAVESALGAFEVEPHSGKANRLKQAAVAAGGVDPPPRQ
jgi:tetratricopeptide (TPR) repeat protein